MKIPRDVGGKELAKLLSRYGYQMTRQTGSHIRLTTQYGGEHHVTIPSHDSIRIGTLNTILQEVTNHLKRDKSEVIRELWG